MADGGEGGLGLGLGGGRRFFLLELGIPVRPGGRDVCGYPKMPVVCFCEEDQIGWVADGSALDARGKRGLVITPGQRWTSKDGEKTVVYHGNLQVTTKWKMTTWQGSLPAVMNL